MKRIYVLAIFLLFYAFNMLNAQDSNPEAEKLYKAGNDTLKAGNYTAAVELYDKALNLKKDHRYYYQKGAALKAAGKVDEAQKEFENSIKEKSDFEAGYNSLAGIYFGKKQYKPAIENYEKILGMSKDTTIIATVKKNLSMAYTMVGNKELSDGNLDSAIAILEKAVSNYDYDAGYLSLAKAYTKKKDYDKSLAAAENALKNRSVISPGGPYYYMGLAYKNKGDNEKAKQMFTEAKSDSTYQKLVEKELAALK